MLLRKCFQCLVVFNMLLFSCDSTKVDVLDKNETFIEYYPNGKIKIKAEHKDSLLNGKYEKYFENGSLEILANYSKGKLTGRYEEYYNSSNLKKDLNFSDHWIQGTQFEYFDTKNMQIKSKKVILKISNSLVTMMNKGYDLDHKLIYDSSKVVIDNDFDTLFINEEKKIKATLMNPEYKIFRLHIGHFNRDFQLIDSIDYFMKESTNPTFAIDIYGKKSGDQYIRGYIEEYYIESKEKNITTTVGNIGSYFEYNYFVK